jgi:hypothetical protein
MYLITTEEGRELFSRWENGLLTKEEWTHEMHLIMGAAVILKFGENALPEMKKRIIRHNEAVGIINSEDSGYHETLTAFWLQTVKQFLEEKNLTVFDEITIDEIICEEKLADRNCWLKFYKLETIQSKEVRRRVVDFDF